MPEKNGVWLVAFDESPASELALEQAAKTLALAGGKLVIAHVVSPWVEAAEPRLVQLGGPVDEPLLTTLVNESKKRLEQVADQTRAQIAEAGQKPVEVSVLARSGLVSEVIGTMAAEVDADLIVVGSHSRKGLERLLLGSVAEKIARDADRPVLVVPYKPDAPDHLPPRRLAVCFEFDDIHPDTKPPSDVKGTAEQAAFDTALSLASSFGAALTVLHVVDAAYVTPVVVSAAVRTEVEKRRDHLLKSRELRLEEVARSAEIDGVQAEARLVTASASVPSTVAKIAEEEGYDILVTATHRKKGLRRVLGSAARRIAQKAGRPVVVVPPEPEGTG